jgi:hypothetical protein
MHGVGPKMATEFEPVLIRAKMAAWSCQVHQRKNSLNVVPINKMTNLIKSLIYLIPLILQISAVMGSW